MERVGKNEIPSLRQSIGAAPLTALQTTRLLDTVEALLEERAELQRILNALPSSILEVRAALNEMSRVLR
jgi:hypothetical protein